MTLNYAQHEEEKLPTNGAHEGTVDDCVFCAIIRGGREATVVYEDDRALSFADIFPLQRGHLLVIPKRHVETIYGLDEELAGHLFRITTKLAKVLKDVLKPDGLNIHQSNERAAGQDILHLHLHIIPRFENQSLIMTARKRAERDELERIFQPVRRALIDQTW
jgi:histidine triad (HIT) family protein